MYGTFLFGEAPPGVSPDVIGEGLFFNSEVLRVGSVISTLLYLTSAVENDTLKLSSAISPEVKLESEVHETTL